QRGASVVIGVKRQVWWVDYIRQKPTFQKVQVTRQDLYLRCCGIDNALTSNANSSNLHLGLLQNEMYKIMQCRWCAWRRLLKCLEQISIKIYKRSFNGRGANVDPNHEGFIRRSVGPV